MAVTLDRALPRPRNPHMANGISRVLPKGDYPDIVTPDRETVDAAWAVWVEGWKAQYAILNPIVTETPLLPEDNGYAGFTFAGLNYTD